MLQVAGTTCKGWILECDIDRLGKRSAITSGELVMRMLLCD
jgi:hypothetical protein